MTLDSFKKKPVEEKKSEYGIISKSSKNKKKKMNLDSDESEDDWNESDWG